MNNYHRVNKTDFIAHHSAKLIKKRLPITLFNRVIASLSYWKQWCSAVAFIECVVNCL